MTTNNGIIVVLEADPWWFGSRRFVTKKPKLYDEFRYIGADRVDDWGVIDLKTNKTILTDLTGEDAGFYADGLEIVYNAYLDHDAQRRASDLRQGRDHQKALAALETSSAETESGPGS